MKIILTKFYKISFFFPLFFLILLSIGASGPGTIYIVLGSDTAIWDGMNTAQYNCVYNPSLYIFPGNTSIVMDPHFRGQFKDSFGDTMKLTWWMMEGNIFRYATNNNIPYPNTMTMHLMKQFYMDKINLFGDELSIHYHTFAWTDYNGDGRYYWNQAKSFMECYDDFNFTLAQTFLEEEIFPVSFRSGWHYMDNQWQNYLNKLLPYSLHNDYPNKRLTDIEPIDNNFDWSLSPSEFIPFNPSQDNYQVQGNSNSWNVRSIHLSNIKNNKALWDSLFMRANRGIDQVACIWGHLPEEDFNSNLYSIDSVLHKYESLYPNVKFRYSTGTEAMQLYRGGTDITPPQIQVQETYSPNQVSYNIASDEPIFQDVPFVAYKDLNENFHIAGCTSLSTNQWSVVIPIGKELIAKAGVVLSDTMGNQSYKIFRYLPDDIFVDNKDQRYSEAYGSWTDNSAYAWGNDSRSALLSENDSARASWTFTIPQSGYYHLYTQFPNIVNHASAISFFIHSQMNNVDTVILNSEPVKNSWVYLSTINFIPGEYKVEILARGNGQEGKIISTDVLKVSPLVGEKAIQFKPGTLNLGEIAQEDSILFDFEVSNNGTAQLSIDELISTSGYLSAVENFPIVIEPMNKQLFKMNFHAETIGNYSDTLILSSDDPLTPHLRIPFFAKVLPYFVIVDNEESVHYKETSGTWANSVAQAYGFSSRIAYLNQNPRASAYFEKTIPKEGTYLIQFIVPKTVNAATRALYKIFVDGIRTDSIHIDQNINSGTWVTIGDNYISANSMVRIEISDPGGSLKQGEAVLRTDAFRIGINDPALNNDEDKYLPEEFSLSQNYPNPFNPVTKIKYSIPDEAGTGKVSLIVYDIIGRVIAVLTDEVKYPGVYETEFNADGLASGVYICRLKAGFNAKSIKMVLLK